jgi:hypothetical protein
MKMKIEFAFTEKNSSSSRMIGFYSMRRETKQCLGKNKSITKVGSLINGESLNQILQKFTFTMKKQAM